MGNGELIVLAGTSKGHVSRLRLAAPLAPGSDPSEVQVRAAVCAECHPALGQFTYESFTSVGPTALEGVEGHGAGT